MGSHIAKSTRIIDREKVAYKFQSVLHLLTVLCFVLSLSTTTAVAQSAFGSISGSVTDPTGAVVPGVQVTVTDEGTGVSQSTRTNDTGEFVFPSLLPATYTVTAEKGGFKKLDKTGLTLVASQRLSAGTFKLSVGAETASVTVSSEGTPVQTTSSEVSSTISTAEMAELPSLSLDYMAFTSVLPGSNYIGWGGSSMGVGSSGVSFNGMTNGKTGNGTYISTNGAYSSIGEGSYDFDAADLDNVQDVHVLQSNYEAQYGRTTGAIINVTTKSGDSQFHGGVYYYLRNEDLNANDYFNKRNGGSRPKYRFNTYGGTAGGPLLIPGWSQESRKKLFFFDIQEAPSKSPEGIQYSLMPTALEETGDFSKSFIPGGTTPVTLTGPLAAAPTIVPQNLINPTMQAALSKIFPKPNFTNAAISNNNYNYVTNNTDSSPTDKQSLRVDYAATEKIRLFARWQRAVNSSTGKDAPGILANGDWQNGADSYINADERGEIGSIYTITPNLVDEASAGWTQNHEVLRRSASDLSQFQQSAIGVSFPNPEPSQNTNDLVPGMEFNGWGPNQGGFDFEPRFPLDDLYTGWSFKDDLTYIKGAHQFKFGAYVDSAVSWQPHDIAQWGNAGSGILNFSNDANSPNSVGDPFAQALMGNFDTYQYSTNKIDLDMLQRQFEWYAQDNLKVTSKLSLNYGVRFSLDIPVKSANQYGSTIDFSQYSAADAPPLFQPNGKGQFVNPQTGQVVPAAYEDLFVPGVGNPAPGAVSAGNKPLAKSRGVLVAPRLGFAYDPLGDQKTVIRGGVGQSFAQRTSWGNVYGNVTNAPTVFFPTQYYGSVGSIATQGGLVGPSSEQYMDPNGHLPYSLQWSLGVERELGFRTVLGVSYVANVSRHGAYKHNINEVPYGAEFLPQNQNSNSNSPLPDDYFRPYPGYNTITELAFGDNSNYNSLQVTLNRKFAHNLTYGVSYTWAKQLDDNRTTTYVPASATYGPVIGQSRLNRLTADWVWELPKGSRHWNNVLSRSVLDNWSFSGIASFISGAADMATCSPDNGENITGGGDLSKCIKTGNAELSRGSRSFNRYFNTSVFALPTPIPHGQTTYTTANIGNQWNGSFYDPGVNNWDLSFMKNIVIRERVGAELRADMTNAFNHPSFTAVNNSGTFNPTTGGLDNASSFGQITGDLGARIIQVSARIKF